VLLAPRLGHLTPGKGSRYPAAGWAPGPVVTDAKYLAPRTRIRFRTAQSVASSYSDCSTPGRIILITIDYTLITNLMH